MAASTIAHGRTTTAENVVSFVDSSVKKDHLKTLKRWKPFVKVSYDSGSDADVDSEEEQKRKEVGSPSKTTKKITRKKWKLEPTANPADPITQADSDGEANDPKPTKAEENDEPRVPGAGWADAMAKILGRDAPAGAGSVVLAKSKDYEKAKKQEHEEIAERRKEKETKNLLEHIGRARPRVTDKEKERKLQRVATRGVVQLFNAVKKQQKRFADKLESTHSEKERAEVKSAVSKGEFLDLLKATPVITKKGVGKAQGDTKPAAKKPAWSVLQDDFMMGASMKDWDKQSDSGTDEQAGGGSDGKSFSDSD